VAARGQTRRCLHLDTLLVNQHEAAAIAAGNSPEELAGGLAERLATRVVVTLGADGVMVAGDGPAHRLAAYPPVRVVDTTGAGDAFAGAFAAVDATPEALRTIIGHTTP
jgi:ribokinase